MPERAAIGEGVFLQPGELVTAGEAVVIKTVLGSCVAITMRSPQLRLAAIAHCVLPAAGLALDAIPAQEAPRYVDTAVELMCRILSCRGASLHNLEVKIFGGADAMQFGYQVGDRNIAAARAALARRGIGVAASVVGGRRGRVLRFDTATGEVLVKTLPGALFDGQAARP